MGQLNLPDGATVYIDTVVVIYTIEGNSIYFSALQPLWLNYQMGRIQLVTSELTLMETLVMPIKTNNTALIDDYEQLLTLSEIQLIPISQAILKNAAGLRATTNLKTPDAIHAATALGNGCTLFLTNDSGLRTVPGLSVVVLKDVLNV
jgi:predicted nucleic acid-binding protein